MLASLLPRGRLVEARRGALAASRLMPPRRHAGHSKWANIQHVKKAKDLKRAKDFATISKEIMSAVKQGGPDPNGNMRLSSALVRARAANMPKDSLERSMKAGMSGGDDLETLQYEAHGPGGVAYIMDVLTDNKNRTVAELRHLFKEAGGALGAAGSASWMFDHVAALTVSVPNDLGADGLLEALIDADVDADVAEAPATAAEGGSDGCTLEVTCDYRAVGSVQRAVAGLGGSTSSVQAEMRPQMLTSTAEDAGVREATLALLDEIEGRDDVQHVWSSADVAQGGEEEEGGDEQ